MAGRALSQVRQAAEEATKERRERISREGMATEERLGWGMGTPVGGCGGEGRGARNCSTIQREVGWSDPRW